MWGSTLYLPVGYPYGKLPSPQLQKLLEREMHSWSWLSEHVWNNQDIQKLSGLPAWQDVEMQKCFLGCVGPQWLQARQNVLRKVGLDPSVGLCPKPIVTVKNLPLGMCCSSLYKLLAKLTQPVLCQEVGSHGSPCGRELLQSLRVFRHDRCSLELQGGYGALVCHVHPCIWLAPHGYGVPCHT